MVQLVKDLDLKAFHNTRDGRELRPAMVQLVKDLDLKAFHNEMYATVDWYRDGTARQRS